MIPKYSSKHHWMFSECSLNGHGGLFSPSCIVRWLAPFRVSFSSLKGPWMVPECSLGHYFRCAGECSLNVPWMFPECSLNTGRHTHGHVPVRALLRTHEGRQTFPEWSLNVPWMFPGYFLNMSWMFPECSLNTVGHTHGRAPVRALPHTYYGRRMFTECSLNGHWMFPEHSLNMPWMFPEHSLNMPWMFPEYRSAHDRTRAGQGTAAHSWRPLRDFSANIFG
jgi:hypothetical protein